MYPISVTICLIIGGIFLFIGLMCDWLEQKYPAIVCAVLACAAMLHPLFYAMTLNCPID